MARNRKPSVAVPGGPHTAAGKRASRANALKHGLASKKVLPDVLRKKQVNEYRVAFGRQYQPANPTEALLVAELARHAMMMDVAEHAEGAVLRHGARELSNVILGATVGTSNKGDEQQDAILAAAVSTDALEKFNRYRRGHEKAFFAALNALREVQRIRREGAADSTRRTSLIVTEEACEKHLARRFRRAEWRCPHCNAAQGSWLERQKRWECGSCRRQVGLRYGTAMQGSRLPLRIWFLAIKAMRQNLNTSTSQMMEILGIRRRGTVRGLMTRITRAMSANEANELLAGIEAPKERGSKLK